MKSALKRKAEKTTKRPAPKNQQTMLAVDALLDEALDETFPASDPVALTQPSLRRRAALKRAGHERARSGAGTGGGRGARGPGGRVGKT
jgi:hypothetical protein